jgi:hypothetical protein
MVAPQQVQTRPQAQQNVQRQPGAAPIVSAPITSTTTPGTGGRVAGGVGGQGISGMKAQQEIGVAGAKENIQVQGQRAQSFNKILDEEVRPQAQAGDTVSSVRKQQFQIFERPGVDTNKLFGLLSRPIIIKTVIIATIQRPLFSNKVLYTFIGKTPTIKSNMKKNIITLFEKLLGNFPTHRIKAPKQPINNDS